MFVVRFRPRPHSAGENLKVQESPVILDLCLRKTPAALKRKAGVLKFSGLKKSSIFKMFPSTRKQRARVFKFLWFEDCFQKAPFS